MTNFKVACNCGWTIETNDKDTLNVACRTHDSTCPALFKPDAPTTGTDTYEESGHGHTQARCSCGGPLPCPYKARGETGHFEMDTKESGHG